jgi:hypothetical protein
VDNNIITNEWGQGMTRPMTAEYAIYKGEDLLAMGTAKECAEVLSVKLTTISITTVPPISAKARQAAQSVGLPFG